MSTMEDFSCPCPSDGYYDLFISFRGLDTRSGFTATLYKSLLENKIYTFMDVGLAGEAIDSLFEEIGRSRMGVVVYSKRFASSAWCLRELEMIVQRKEKKNMMMIPIFYKVDVHQLKHPSEKTVKYFDQHIEKYGMINVNKWKDVVTRVGDFSGFPYKDVHGRSEYDFIIQSVIPAIKKKLREWKNRSLEISTGNKPADNSGSAEIRAISRLALGEGSASGSFDASVSDEVGVSEMYTASKMVDEEVLSSNDHQQQAHEIEKDLACDKNIEKALKVPQEDGDEEVYRIVTSAYFQKSMTVITGDLVKIEPCYLIFYVEPEKPSSSWFTLTNKTDNYVAFMLKMDTKKQQNYSINPNKGVLLPGSRFQVQVTMEAQTVFPSHEVEESKDMFLIQSVEAKKDSYSTNDFSNLFTEKLSRFFIYKYLIEVLYVAPPGDSSVPKPIDQLLANKGLIQDCMIAHSIDMHPTKPWLLLAFYDGEVSIWNYETRAEEKSFKFDDWGSGYAKFIHEKHWILVGGNEKGFVLVFNYNTSEKMKEFKAHEDSLRCIKVHPTSPYVLTTSDDKLVKLWNWENDWACSETFQGHSYHVMDVAFNPKDSTSFASASYDGTIKIWSSDSSIEKFTINAHTTALTCVEYFVGNDNKLYLLSGSWDNTARVWDYESKTLVQTLEGHSKVVWTTIVHPKLPIILTTSWDKTIRIWNKDTHWLKLVWSCDLGKIWSIEFIQTSDEVVLGCEDGIVVIKIVNEAGTQSD